ncbi:MAG TPA: hypothetical protein VGD01_03875, partial [Candidatus Elarobacter sp.]
MAFECPTDTVFQKDHSLKRSIFMIVASCIAFAGCGGPATHSDSIAAHLSAGAPTKTQDSVNKMMSALEQKLPAGTRVFQTDSIVVHAGDNFAQFAAASRVTRSAS